MRRSTATTYMSAVDGKRVVDWEAEMRAFNRKTTDLTKFKAYIQKKNEREALNARLALVLQRVHLPQAQARQQS
jgi:hypothetical protein